MKLKEELLEAFISPFKSINSIFNHPAHNIHNIKDFDPIDRCIFFEGTLNEPHAKCKRCGKEEWQHKI